MPCGNSGNSGNSGSSRDAGGARHSGGCSARTGVDTAKRSGRFNPPAIAAASPSGLSGPLTDSLSLPCRPAGFWSRPGCLQRRKDRLRHAHPGRPHRPAPWTPPNCQAQRRLALAASGTPGRCERRHTRPRHSTTATPRCSSVKPSMNSTRGTVSGPAMGGADYLPRPVDPQCPGAASGRAQQRLSPGYGCIPAETSVDLTYPRPYVACASLLQV